MCREAIQGLPAGEIFPFEWRPRIVALEFLDRGVTEADQCQRERKFRDVNFPVAAQFEQPAQRDKGVENRVSVPATLQMLGLRPRVWIQQIVLRHRPFGATRKAPQVDAIAAR